MAEGSDTVNSIVRAGRSVQYRGMYMVKPLFVLTAALVLIQACTPFSIYHQPGVEVSRMQSDLLNCQVASSQSVPVSTQIRREPPRYIPGRHYCRPDGRCYRDAGYYIPGEVYTVDANAGLRGRVTTQCMADRGYRPVELPACSGAVKARAPQGVTTVLPPLDEKSCVIRNDDRTWQIVTTR